MPSPKNERMESRRSIRTTREARVKVEWAAAVGEGESDHHSKIVHLDHHSIVHLDHQLRAAKVKRLAQAKCTKITAQLGHVRAFEGCWERAERSNSIGSVHPRRARQHASSRVGEAVDDVTPWRPVLQTWINLR